MLFFFLPHSGTNRCDRILWLHATFFVSSLCGKMSADGGQRMIYQVGIAPQIFHDINLLALAGIS